jgi:hypothetical protein
MSPTMTVTSTTRARVASVAAVLFAVAFFCCVAVVNVPHDPTNAELLRWWRDSGNRLDTIYSSFFAIAAAVLFAVVMNHLGATSDRGSAWWAFARSMGTATVAMLLVTGALRGVIGHLTIVMNEPLPNVDVLRYATAANYALVAGPLMSVLALAILAVAVLVPRERLLAPWVGYTGVVAAGLILVAVAAQYGGLAIPVANLWMIGLSIALWRGPSAPLPDSGPASRDVA